MIVPDPSTFRANIINKLIEIFSRTEKDDTHDFTSLCRNIEIGVFNFAIKEANARKIVKKWDNPHFVQLYNDRMRSLYINLKNPDFINQIKTKDITTKQLLSMTHQEMNPDHWKEYIERKVKRDMSKLNTNVEASTDMFTCKKCKSNRCTYYELQTRSADEPTTVFITCLDCGKHWKI